MGRWLRLADAAGAVHVEDLERREIHGKGVAQHPDLGSPADDLSRTAPPLPVCEPHTHGGTTGGSTPAEDFLPLRHYTRLGAPA